MKTRILYWFFLHFLLVSTSWAQAPERGLVLHYSARAPGQDLSGHQNHGEWHSIGIDAGIPGVSEHSMAFDGSASYIRVPPSASLIGCRSISIAAWFSTQSFPSSTGRSFIVSQWFPEKSASMGLIFFWDALSFYLTDGDVVSGVPMQQFLTKNTWYHLAGVYDAEAREVRLYLNGMLREVRPMGIKPFLSPGADLYVGVQNFNGQISNRFPGNLEDLRIYDRPISGDEVRMLTKNFVFPKPEAAFARLAQLDAGRYILTPVGSSLQYAGTRQIVQISAEEPFWKKPWFIGGSIAAAFLFSFGFTAFYFHQRQQEQAYEFEKMQLLERERFRIARQMHDDIGSGLSAINLLTEIALNKSSNPQLAAEIGRIAATAREVNGRIQDIIWTIGAQNDTLGGLLDHLQSVANELLAPAGILLERNLPSNLPAISLPGPQRRALFLAFKEAIHNVVKHSKATQTSLNLTCGNRQLFVRIQDNGLGFDPASAGGHGNGLVNMRRRMEEAGGQFDIHSTGSGTLVEFILPF
jgi:signal transduction histidine kinase